MVPEKPFTPIFAHPVYRDLDVKSEVQSNLISHNRPQRNQRLVRENSHHFKQSSNQIQSTNSFTPSLKGPIDFYPSVKGIYACSWQVSVSSCRNYLYFSEVIQL